MTNTYATYNFVIIGGGIFGAYAALYLASNKQKVCLIEKESNLFTKASVVNQARLHSGYHYPRSVATALMSDDNKARFTDAHKDFINFKFEKYYAIDKFGSFTDSLQFERFCEYIKIKCQAVSKHPLFNFDRIESLFATTEYTFDPFLIANYYITQLEENANIEILKNTKVIEAEPLDNTWKISIQTIGENQSKELKAQQVVNATYAGSNAINQLFGQQNIELMHEISEMVLLSSPRLQHLGLTVMDGQYGSLMPYGLSGLLSLSSVAYTHHKVSYNNLPTFDCQKINTACKPNFTSNCNYCSAQPKSNQLKMFRQIQHYFSSEIQMQYFKSLFTIKSKLKANYIDDGRPTEISILNENPRFYCIFAGKINSIYEIEKVIQF